MVAVLPIELQQQVLLRHAQLEQLNLFYNSGPHPSTLVVYGSDETAGQLETLHKALTNWQHITIDCRECLSQRHLLTKIFSQCVQTLTQDESQLDRFDRLDNINALAANLKKLLHGRGDRLILILSNADRQRGATPTLFPALARFPDIIPCLSLVLTSTSPRPLQLHKSGIPYIHFPPYSRQEAIQLLLTDPPPLLPSSLPSYSPIIDETKLKNIYNQFATVVYDTLVAPTTISTAKYRTTIERLWPRFIWPLVSAQRVVGRNATPITAEWDFARLLSRGRALFQAEGEEALQERLIPITTEPSTFEELIKKKAEDDEKKASTDPPRSLGDDLSKTTSAQSQPSTTSPPLLKYLPTILLLSSYLASHTHPKHDIVLFSRLSTASSTNRRKKKYLARSRAGGITKTPTKSPSKKKKDVLENDDDDDNDVFQDSPVKKSSSAETPKKERADRSMRAIFEKTSNIARPFTLERVIAILRAIHPDGIKMGKGIADRVYVELGELERLRLVVRAEAGKKVDPEDVMEERWKCILGREGVVEMGRRWNVGLEGWEVE